MGNFRIFEGFKKETNTNKDIVMENKLQQLTRKLYDEGLEKGRAEAERLVSEAETAAGRIESEARARAEEIVRRAEAQAEDLSLIHI